MRWVGDEERESPVTEERKEGGFRRKFCLQGFLYFLFEDGVVVAVAAAQGVIRMICLPGLERTGGDDNNDENRV